MAHALLTDWDNAVERFGKVMPKDYKRVLLATENAEREGRELVGWGMACGIWEAMMQQSSVHAALTPDGRLELGNATGDLGTGTYTILTQIAADALGLRMTDVTTKLGDSKLADAPIAGGETPTLVFTGTVEVASDARRVPAKAKSTFAPLSRR